MTSSCRICLSPNTCKEISSLPIALQVDSSVEHVMRFCLSIEITEDTSRYNRLCSSCHRSIIRFYTFKELALTSDNYLHSLKGSQGKDNLNDGESEFSEVLVKVEDLCDVDVLTIGDATEIGDDNDIIQEYATEIKDEPPDNNSKKICEKDSKAKKQNLMNLKCPCQICGCLFVNITYVDRHIIRLHHKERQFFCHDCNAGFYLKEALEKHIRAVHKGERKYHCPICSRGFYKKFHYDFHMRSHYSKEPRINISHRILEVPSDGKENEQLPSVKNHKPLKSVTCEFCSKRYKNSTGLEKHMSLHLEDKRFFCNDCDSSYYVKQALEMHILKSHLKIPIEEIADVCQICGKSYRCLREHLRTHQPKPSRDHLCSQCPKTFTTKLGLTRHHKFVHVQKRVKCTICNKEVLRIKAHNLRQHSSRPFACKCCPLTFATELLLRSHVTTHTQERPFECSHCGNHYKSKHIVERHIRALHMGEKKFLCQVCSKSFFSKNHFARHLASHTDVFKYKCDICQKAMKTAEGLRIHMDNHQGVKRFECEVCGLGFASSNGYNAHKLSHTDEKKHACRFCGIRYKRTNHRNRHEITVHGKLGQHLPEAMEPLRKETEEKSQEGTVEKSQEIHVPPVAPLKTYIKTARVPKLK